MVLFGTRTSWTTKELLTLTYGGVVAVRKTLVFSNPEKLPLFGFAIPRTFHDLLVQIF